MTDERHPPRRKTAPFEQGGELLYYSPIEGGFKGGVPYLFLFILFYQFWCFQNRASCWITAPDEDKNKYPPHPDPLPQWGEEKNK